MCITIEIQPSSYMDYPTTTIHELHKYIYAYYNGSFLYTNNKTA